LLRQFMTVGPGWIRQQSSVRRTVACGRGQGLNRDLGRCHGIQQSARPLQRIAMAQEVPPKSLLAGWRRFSSSMGPWLRTYRSGSSGAAVGAGTREGRRQEERR
jgi:hypothetical protein